MRAGLILYGSLEPTSGGNLYDGMLVEHLRARGHEVDVVSLAPGGYLRHLAQSMVPGRARRWARPGYDVILQDELAHASLFRPNLSLRQVGGAPLVSIVHHLRVSEDWSPGALRLYRSIERRYLESVDAFVYNSDTTRASVEALLERETRHIVATPGGDRLAPLPGRDEIDRRAARDGSARLLFVGNLIPRKRAHVLLEALAPLREGPWRLDVAGSLDADPDYVQAIRARLEDLGLGERVRLLGRLDGDELAARYRDADVFVLPSRYEGFGIVYLEAMGFGLPVVAGDSGASAEIVRHETNGLLVQPDDPRALTAAILRLLDDRALRTRLSQGALDTFSRHPGWEASMSAVEAFLVDLIARQRGGA